MHNANDRREFMKEAAFLLALTCPTAAAAQVQPEVRTHWIELPAHAEFWGVVAFLGDTFVEVTIGNGRQSQAFKGRFDGTRLTEFSWPNKTNETIRLGIRAMAVAESRELAPSTVEYHGSTVGSENTVVTFGRRAVPADPGDRIGSYPYEAAVFGLVGFGK
jgi:hypothetical protein